MKYPVIKVCEAKAQGAPKVIPIANTLQAFQAAVDGYIETVNIPGLIEEGILMIANEEGFLRGLPVNENLLPFLYVGDVVFCSMDTDGNFASLSHEQLGYLKGWLEGLKER